MFEKSSLQYHVFKDYNIQFDEKGATCGTVRKAQWVEKEKNLMKKKQK